VGDLFLDQVTGKLKYHPVFNTPTSPSTSVLKRKY